MTVTTAAMRRYDSMVTAAKAPRLAIGQNPRTRISTKAVKKMQETLQMQLEISSEVRRLIGGYAVDFGKFEKHIKATMKYMNDAHKGVYNFLWYPRYMAAYKSLLEYIGDQAGLDSEDSAGILAGINENISHLDSINIFLRRHSIRVGMLPLGMGAIIILGLVYNRDFYVELTRDIVKKLKEGAQELASSPVLDDLMRKMKKREERDMMFLIEYAEGL